MAFDFGFNFRQTAGFVTDPAYAAPVLGEASPTTYTNGNGLSINAGWSVSLGATTINAAAANDPRIAGVNYHANDAAGPHFDVDLSSGSAPGSGTYKVDLAVGHPGGANTQDFKLFDNTTLLIDGTNAGVGINTAADHFVDATLADVSATTTWTGATANKVFATTTPKLQIAIDNIGDFTTLAHFRLTAVATFSMRSLGLLGVGV